jgi:hypothetical protein
VPYFAEATKGRQSEHILGRGEGGDEFLGVGGGCSAEVLTNFATGEGFARFSGRPLAFRLRPYFARGYEGRALLR